MSRLRSLLDFFWLAAFAAIVLTMQLRSGRSATTDASLPLDLQSGEQRQGLYRSGQRLGTVTFAVRRSGKSWRVRHHFELGKGGTQRAAEVSMQLRADLSLAHLRLEADLGVVAQLAGLPPLMMRELAAGGPAQLRLEGDCVSETGVCQLVGGLGRRHLSLPITAGRGPVLTGTIYPLLARGSLGRKAEVTIFDPLSLRQHVVAFQIEGDERLRPLHGGPTVEAIRVSRDLSGIATRVWIDRRGTVLREEMPLGFTLEHESWRPL